MTICYPTTATWTPPDGAETEKVHIALALAWTNLQSLLGFSLAICPIEVRPCRQRCSGGVWQAFPVTGMSPFSPGINGAGQWVNNCGCAADPCSCSAVSEVVLPGPVGRIDEVRIDNVVLPKTAYRVDDGARLVRQDGGVWPDCQDMNLPAGAPGTWTVRYFRGDAPTELDDWAAGLLAAEVYKALTGDKKCRLPSGVTNVVRNGVSLDLDSSALVMTSTGIPELDRYIATRNPYRLTQPSRVKSPDSRRARVTTWGR